MIYKIYKLKNIFNPSRERGKKHRLSRPECGVKRGNKNNQNNFYVKPAQQAQHRRKNTSTTPAQTIIYTRELEGKM